MWTVSGPNEGRVGCGAPSTQQTAAKFRTDLALLSIHASMIAASSRSVERAQNLADRRGSARGCGSVDALTEQGEP